MTRKIDLGTASAALRQEMCDRILRGEFPTEKYQNQYPLIGEAACDLEQVNERDMSLENHFWKK